MIILLSQNKYLVRRSQLHSTQIFFRRALFTNREKSLGTKSGDYGECGSNYKCNFAIILNYLWLEALSRWMRPFFYMGPFLWFPTWNALVRPRNSRYWLFYSTFSVFASCWSLSRLSLCLWVLLENPSFGPCYYQRKKSVRFHCNISENNQHVVVLSSLWSNRQTISRIALS